MKAPYRGRFAPSPTGPLHMGSLVAALASWLDARAAGGEWIVRVEDIDTTRTVPGAAEDILATLEAFGLVADRQVEWQTRRLDGYEAALERLRVRGEVYRCRCTRREIADSGVRGPEGPVYPGTCRDRGLPADIACAERFRAAGAVEFEDRVQGTICQDVAADIGDFVLKRRDGLHAYQLAVVVDDAEQGINHVVRGADLLWSTPRQILLQRALSLPTPRYLHVPIVTNAAGEKLSKQTLAQPIRGGDPAAVREALRWLGQEVPGAADTPAILAAAVDAWRPERIPRRERG